MSPPSNPVVQAVKAGLYLPVVPLPEPVGKETEKAFYEGDEAARKKVRTFVLACDDMAREECAAVDAIMGSDNGGRTDDASAAIMAKQLREYIVMSRSARRGVTAMDPPSPVPAELICTAPPAAVVEANLFVVVARWDDADDFTGADLVKLLARVKRKLEATWPLFEGSDYAHKNPDGELKIVLTGRLGDVIASLDLKDGHLEHRIWNGDLSLFARASRIVVVDEKAWAIDVQSVLYFVYRTTADIIWLFGDEDEPGHKVLRAQTLRDMLRETAAVNVQEVLPFLCIQDMIAFLERIRQALPSKGKWVPRKICDALRVIQAEESTPCGDSAVKLWPPVAIEGPNKTETSISATYVTRVGGRG